MSEGAINLVEESWRFAIRKATDRGLWVKRVDDRGVELRLVPHVDWLKTSIAKKVGVFAEWLGPEPKGAKQTVCVGWDGQCPRKAKPPAEFMYPSSVKKRNGGPWRCRRCANARTHASMTPEQLRARARKGNAAMRRAKAKAKP